MSHFYGAPAMGLMTVGAGTLLVGDRLIGTGPALIVDIVLWSIGTVLGLVTSVLVPYKAFTSHDVREDSAFGGWLMPVVPPMVSAATGALLAPSVLPAPYGRAFEAMALVYGVPVWGFAVLWLAIAAMLTLRTAHRGMPFSLTWWSFTFPVGTIVTATSGLGEPPG